MAGHEVLQVVLPARCPVSGDVVPKPGLIAPSVWGRLDFIDQPFCPRCGVRFEIPVEDDTLCATCLTEPPEFDRARAVLAYDDASRDMLLGFKHGDQTHLIRTFLPWLVRAGAEFRDGVDMIVPVPLHRGRLLKRRYNQSALLAGVIARDWGVAFCPDGLVRHRATPSQGHLTRHQRLDNVRGAFAVPKPGMVAGKNIVLIDDVYTTGATVKSCAHALKKAGAARVDVLVLARVIRPEYL